MQVAFVQARVDFSAGPSKFDELRRDGRMPHAKIVDGRKVWDVRKVDDDFDALPDESAVVSDKWGMA